MTSAFWGVVVVSTGVVFALAEQFPEPKRHRIQEPSRSYTRVVAEEEWLLL